MRRVVVVNKRVLLFSVVSTWCVFERKKSLVAQINVVAGVEERTSIRDSIIVIVIEMPSSFVRRKHHCSPLWEARNLLICTDSCLVKGCHNANTYVSPLHSCMSKQCHVQQRKRREGYYVGTAVDAGAKRANCV